MSILIAGFLNMVLLQEPIKSGKPCLNIGHFVQNKIELPEPDLYAHELIQNGGGVWLGCETKGICEQSYVEGETGDVIIELYSAERVLGLIRAAVLAERAACREIANKQRYNQELLTTSPLQSAAAYNIYNQINARGNIV